MDQALHQHGNNQVPFLTWREADPFLKADVANEGEERIEMPVGLGTFNAEHVIPIRNGHTESYRQIPRPEISP